MSKSKRQPRECLEGCRLLSAKHQSPDAHCMPIPPPYNDIFGSPDRPTSQGPAHLTRRRAATGSAWGPLFSMSGLHRPPFLDLALCSLKPSKP